MFRTVRASTPAPIISTKRRPFTRPMSNEIVLPPAMTAHARSTRKGSPNSRASTFTVPAGTMPNMALRLSRRYSRPGSTAAHRGVTLAGRATGGHSVGHLVDGPISPHGHDDVGIGREALSDRHGILGVVRSMELHLQSSLDQLLLYRRGDHSASPPTRSGVEDDDRSHVRGARRGPPGRGGVLGCVFSPGCRLSPAGGGAKGFDRTCARPPS